MLQEAFPGKRGLSERSVRRFCCENDIHSQQHLSQDDLEQCARAVVAKVGDKCEGPATGLKAYEILKSGDFSDFNAWVIRPFHFLQN